MRTLGLFTLALCMLPLPTAAQSPAVVPAANAPTAHCGFSAEVGLTTRERSTIWVASPVLGVRYHFRRPITLSVDWGFIFADQSPAHGASQLVFGSGNAALSISYAMLRTPSDRLEFYLSVVPPLAWLPESTARRGFVRGSYAYAAATRGFWDAWLWGPEQLTTGAGGYWSRTAPNLRYGAQVGLAASLPLQTVRNLTTGYFVQLAPYIELREALGPQGLPFSLGVRLQSVIMTAGSDLVQLSLSPYAGLDTGPVALQLRGVLNLDEPSGFIGSGLGIWGLLFSAQGQL